MIIYKVINLVNGKIYIGLTTGTLAKRKGEHIREALNYDSKYVFHKAIRKYGKDNFKWVVIDTAKTTDDLIEKEIYWIDFYNSYTLSENSNGYNTTLGGEGTFGYKRTKEQIESWSKSFKKNGKMLGSNHHSSKLTEDDVLEIKELIKKRTPINEIAIRFGVSSGTIADLKRGKVWSHVGDDVSQVKYNAGNSILKEDDVREIRSLLEDKVKQKEIAIMFNIDQSVISNIKTGKYWSHVI